MFLLSPPAPTVLYTLSLHDALPISRVMNHHYKGCGRCKHCRVGWSQLCPNGIVVYGMTGHGRSEEHTSELQSHSDLVCRLLLEKKNCRYDRRPIPSLP